MNLLLTLKILPHWDVRKIPPKKTLIKFWKMTFCLCKIESRMWFRAREGIRKEEEKGEIKENTGKGRT